MLLAGFTGSDFEPKQFEALGAQVTKRQGPGVVVVQAYNASMQYDSYDENRYRPYLRLDVDVLGARGQFGGDVTEFRYREDDKPSRAVRFDFTDEELASLVMKGLYNPEFELPDVFTESELEIPMELTTYLVETDGHRFVFSQEASLDDFHTDSVDSGYPLAEYFEQQVPTYSTAKEIEKEDETETVYTPEVGRSDVNYEDALNLEAGDEPEEESFEEELDDTQEDYYEESPVQQTPIFVNDELSVMNDLRKLDVHAIDDMLHARTEERRKEESAEVEKRVEENNTRPDVVTELDSAKTKQAELNRQATGGGMSVGGPDADDDDIPAYGASQDAPDDLPF